MENKSVQWAEETQRVMAQNIKLERKKLKGKSLYTKKS